MYSPPECTDLERVVTTEIRNSDWVVLLAHVNALADLTAADSEGVKSANILTYAFDKSTTQLEVLISEITF